jgi:hypothetical protein
MAYIHGQQQANKQSLPDEQHENKSCFHSFFKLIIFSKIAYFAINWKSSFILTFLEVFLFVSKLLLTYL